MPSGNEKDAAIADSSFRPHRSDYSSRVIPKSVFNGRNVWPALAIFLIFIATALQLHHQGRSWWCFCGRGFLWVSDAWGSQTSQAFLDPYSFTHVLHGIIFAGLLTVVIRGMPPSWRLCLAIGIESVWEILENTNSVIDRYREATAALGYHGDTVVNSLGDIVCCGIGFLVARKIGFRWSLILFLATEAILLVWIKDSLLLEVIMLIFPLDAIKAWQMGY